MCRKSLLVRTVSLLTISVLCSSCEDMSLGVFTKRVTPDIPPVPQIALLSFISPQDSVISAEVTWVEKTVGEVDFRERSGDPIVGAEVWISDFRDSVQLSRFSTFQGYSISQKEFPIRAGMRYRMSIITSEGERAEAFCTVPVHRVDSNEITFIRRSDDPNALLAQWPDVSPGEDYYHVFNYIIDFESGSPPSIASELNYFNITDRSIEDNLVRFPDLIYSGRQEFSADRIRKQIVQIGVVEETYHEFHKTLDQLRLINDDPFAEPLPLPGNVEGGYGIFAAYNAVQVEVE